jgi:hypothetical protein
MIAAHFTARPIARRSSGHKERNDAPLGRAILGYYKVPL